MDEKYTPSWWAGATTVTVTADVGTTQVNNTFSAGDVSLTSLGVVYDSGGGWGRGFIPWSHIVNVVKAS